MADTYGDILDTIALETRRPRATFGSRIELCVKEAIVEVEPETYWFNDTQALTFSTVANQSAYGSADLSTIPYLTDIENVSVTIGSSDVRDLRKVAWQDIENLIADGVSTGQPSQYAYAFKKLHLYPVPNAVWTVSVAAAYTLTELSADADSNCWTVRREGEPLVRCLASAKFYATHLRLPERAAEFAGQAQGHRNRLIASTSRRQATGNIRPSL